MYKKRTGSLLPVLGLRTCIPVHQPEGDKDKGTGKILGTKGTGKKWQYSLDEKLAKTLGKTTLIQLVLVFCGHEAVYIGEGARACPALPAQFFVYRLSFIIYRSLFSLLFSSLDPLAP